MNGKLLKILGVTHVVTMGKELKPAFPNDFQYLHIKIDDMPSVKIDDHFEETHNFIDQCLENNGRVLVHCLAGISRSSTIVISYLMKRQRLDAHTATCYVQRIREVVSPNFGFRRCLDRWQQQLGIPNAKIIPSPAIDDIPAQSAEERDRVQQKSIFKQIKEAERAEAKSDECQKPAESASIATDA